METPPRWATWLLTTFSHPDTQEEVEGDLLELYAHWCQTIGRRRANWRYAFNAIRLLRPLARPSSQQYQPHLLLSTDMIRSYITIARRQLWRNRLFTLLNVIGLSIGLSACWIIYRLVAFDLGFDTQNPNRDQIVRIVSRFVFDGKESGNPGTPQPMADAIRGHIAGVDRVVPVRGRQTERVLVPQRTGKPLLFTKADQDISPVLVDTNYFRMIPYQWLAGQPAQALTRPNQVVLTQQMAAHYFPQLTPDQVLGHTVIYWDTLRAQVAGVVATLPYRSDFIGQEFISLASDTKRYDPVEWTNTNGSVQLYLMLNPRANRSQVLAQINQLSTQRSAKALERWGSFKRWHLFQPLADLHFGTDYRDAGRRANKTVLYGLISLAGFILILAIINYVNLSSAQVPQRAREIGIRKTLGSRRRTIVFQFLGETAVITLLAFGLAGGLAVLFFGTFRELIPVGIDVQVDWWGLGLFLVGLLVGVVLLAGIYPGWLIARFQPAAVLRGQTGLSLTEGTNRLTLRKSLIVFQFFVAQVFIVGTLIVNQQLRYALQADMGFVRDAVLTASVPWRSVNGPNPTQRVALKQELLKLPGVAAVSLGNQPASNSYSSNAHQRLGLKQPIEISLYRKYVDVDYLPLYELPLLAGRNLHPSDTTREYVLNETAAKAFGFASPQAAIGALLKENGGEANRTVPIVGVIRDFHTRSFRDPIVPVALMTNRDNLDGFNIRLASGQSADWPQVIANISRVWTQFYPDAPFEYKFYDQTLADFYQQELQLAKIVNLATAIAILISCLGLFGLATLTAHQRTKEIGIRKVLGASVASVVTLLSRDFLILVLVAIVLASPLAWWLVHQYLAQFAYKVNLSSLAFVGAALLSISIAILTVSVQSIRAALANPVTSLRSE